MKQSIDCLRQLSLSFLFVSILFTACKKDPHGNPGVSAKGSLQNTEGNCLPGTPHGKWTVGLRPGDSSYVEVTVHVTRPGKYSIQSDSVNGVRFKDAGIFTSTGDRLIRLRPTGYFDTAMLTGYHISFDNSSCGFNIGVDTLPGLGANQWHFTANGRLYHGTTEGRLYLFPPQGMAVVINNDQEGVPGTDTVMFMYIDMPYDFTETVYPGTWPNVTFRVSTFAQGTILDGTHKTYDQASVTTTLVGLIDPTPEGFRQWRGTFGGTAVDPRDSSVVRITNGEFHTSGF